MAKIMLVEDDNSLREIYSIRLVAEGYEVVSAGDGEEALAIAVRERPDLIVSDVMMPKISGFDMLDILRSTPETKNIKVIMMTALSSEDQRQRGESLGADRYLVKSQVGIEDVVNAVKEVLGEAVAAPEGVAPTAAEAPTVVAPTATGVPATPTGEAIAPASGAMPAMATTQAEASVTPTAPTNPVNTTASAAPATPVSPASAASPAAVNPATGANPIPAVNPAASVAPGVPVNPGVTPETPVATQTIPGGNVPPAAV